MLGKEAVKHLVRVWVWVKILNTRNWTADFSPWFYLRVPFWAPTFDPQPFQVIVMCVQLLGFKGWCLLKACGSR